MKKIGKVNQLVLLSFFFLGLIGFSSLIASTEAFGQNQRQVSMDSEKEIRVQAGVDGGIDTVGVGERFSVTVTVSSNEQVEFQDPRVPNIDGFVLLNQNLTNSVRTSFVNGKMTREINKGFTYLFESQQAGTFSIGSFEVVIDGKVYRTEPLLMKVTEEPQGTQRNSKSRQGLRGIPQMDEDSMDPFQRLEEEMFNQLLQRRGIQLPAPGNPGQDPSQPSRPQVDPQLRTLPTNPNEAFFIQVEVDKLEVYENEQVTVSWYLYTRGQMESLDRVKFPDLKGFWKEIIEEIPQLQFTEEIINGVLYRRALLASHALFPIKAGTALIDEYKIKARVRMPSRNFGFNIGKSYEYTKTSKKTEIKVKPLPLEGRPPSFTGAVGKFNIQARTDATNFVVNQPFSLKIRFEGSGNAKLIELPAVNWPTGIEIYDTKSDSKFFKNGTSFKEFEVLIIPRQTGSIEIPSIQFSMFDPQSQKYEIKSTEAFKLDISENPKEDGAYNQKSPTQATVTPGTGKPILPDIIRSEDFSDSSSLASVPLFWPGLYGLVFGVLLMKAQREFEWGKKRKSLREKIEPRIKRIDAAMKKNAIRQLGAETINTYYFVLGEIAGEGGGSQEIQKILNLIPSSLRRDYAPQIMKSFEKFQTLAFAPEEGMKDLAKPENLKKIVQEAKDLIQKLAREGSSNSTEST